MFICALCRLACGIGSCIATAAGRSTRLQCCPAFTCLCKSLCLSVQCATCTADTIELHPEVQHAAQQYFGLQPGLHGGRAMVGDATHLVPRLAAEAGPRYDYVQHDVFR